MAEWYRPDSPSSVAGAAAAGSEMASLDSTKQTLLEILRNIGQPLFAVLDASRDLRISGLVRASRERYRSLYEGKQADYLMDVAPYLVLLSENTNFLETLLREGWGKSWGVFVASEADLTALRGHLRRFLLVRTPKGSLVYFRYYDPRVLRVYLPTCNAAETQYLFGPINAYLCEDETPDTLLVFQPGESSPVRDFVELSARAGESLPSSASVSASGTKELKAALFSP
jgi:hypothetical protein